MNIKNKKALILRGANGIGNAVVMKLVEKGAQVVIHFDRSEPDAYDLCDMISNDGGVAIPVLKDLTYKESASELFKELEEIDFIPDILINNGSLSPYEMADDLSGADGNDIIPFSFLKEFVLLAGKSVVVLNLLDGSIQGVNRAEPYQIPGKAFLSQSYEFCIELAPSGRVNTIVYNGILPPSDLSGREKEKWKDKVIDSNLLKTIGSIEQITDSAEFLIKNNFITGQILFVDGGNHFKSNFYKI